MFQFYSIMTTYTDLPIKSRLRLYFFMRGIRTGLNISVSCFI